MPGLDATVFTNVTRPGYVYSVCVCIFVYSCKCVCVCTGVMGKCQDCVCVSLLSLSFYPPSHHAGPSSQTGLSHVYTASRPLFHLLFVLLLHTSSSIKLSRLSCAEQEEGALPH